MSVCLPHQSTPAASVCGGFAAERPMDRRYKSIPVDWYSFPACGGHEAEVA